MPRIRRAIISVYNKSGILEFAQTLTQLGVKIISTGGTANFLRSSGIEITAISEVTQFPEILDGRVKTLHPRIYGGLLSLRDNDEHLRQLSEHNIEPIDLVVVNLYPFEETVSRPNVELAEALENIDIGGPCMIRAAAKNHLDVAVVTAPEQYGEVKTELLQGEGWLSPETRARLAVAAFQRTADYDYQIQHYLASTSGQTFPERLQLNLQLVQNLRYGENPHQKAALYRDSADGVGGLPGAEQLHGKELSYNNLIDADAALGIVQEFEEPCVVILKHTNPCGAAIGANLSEAYKKANATDPVSAFGGIVGINRPMDLATAEEICQVFTEVVIAPDYESDALERLIVKKNIRLLRMPEITKARAKSFALKRVQGGVLVQDQDFHNIHDIEFRVVSKRQPTAEEWLGLKFGWRICKWVKSNAIVYALKDRTVGIGAGQMSRVDASRLAVEKARQAGLATQDSVLASDAFFPFRDGVDVAAEAGATAVIEPGGSMRDDEVIQAADEHEMALVFTGVRHFRH